jgi:hypothetical protein
MTSSANMIGKTKMLLRDLDRFAADRNILQLYWPKQLEKGIPHAFNQRK